MKKWEMREIGREMLEIKESRGGHEASLSKGVAKLVNPGKRNRC